MTVSCGQATIKLLEAYGVDMVFGIPGVHTLEFCRGLAESSIKHVQARNEQGAGFMADGYARMSGRPGVGLVISGPGVTNAATALGQSFADSVPVLLLSSEAESHTLGKGWGMLHEVRDLTACTAPLTAFSATARSPDDVPQLLARAFSIFSSQRPRPVHIAIPIDVLAQSVTDDWRPVICPPPPGCDHALISKAVERLKSAEKPMLLIGGGAANAGQAVMAIAEKLGAPVISSINGKGIVPDDHDLGLGGGVARREGMDCLDRADVILAIGTELSDTDCFSRPFRFGNDLIRIDLDPEKINDHYPAWLGIVGDAATASRAILEALSGYQNGQRRATAASDIGKIKTAISENLSVKETQHHNLLQMIRKLAPVNTRFAGDMCQLVYTGAFAMPVSAPRLWHYPAGYCTLGCALPNAIGGKLALPDDPVMILVGDGGFQFTSQELVCAAELKLPIPIILWDNQGLMQIQDDMKSRGIPLVGVEGINPDFEMLAKSCHSYFAEPGSESEFSACLSQAFEADAPTLIRIVENSDWLQ